MLEVEQATDYRLDSMPFGGVKSSGLGKEGIFPASFLTGMGLDRRSASARHRSSRGLC